LAEIISMREEGAYCSDCHWDWCVCFYQVYILCYQSV